jgi:hypothetical protein
VADLRGFNSVGVARRVGPGDGAGREVTPGIACVNSTGTAAGSGGAAQAESSRRRKKSKTGRMDGIINYSNAPLCVTL